LDDSVDSKVSIMSSETMGSRSALIFALAPIADKIRSFGRCGMPGCEACDEAFRIADGIDALVDVSSSIVSENDAMVSKAKH
jgi:hypothetical protein